MKIRTASKENAAAQERLITAENTDFREIFMFSDKDTLGKNTMKYNTCPYHRKIGSIPYALVDIESRVAFFYNGY